MPSISNRPPLPSRLFLTDEARCPDPLPAIGGLSPGTGVIFRHYESNHRAALAKQIAALCGRKKLILLIAADPELARYVGASGVHLPSWYYKTRKRPPGLAPNWLVTAAAHSEREIRAAEAAGAAALVLGPVFPTQSHPEAKTLGPKGFAELAALTHLQVYAVGGINEANFKTLPGISNLAGFAGISGFGG